MSLQNLLSESTRRNGGYFGDFKYLNQVRPSTFSDKVLFKVQINKLQQLERNSQSLQRANEVLEEMGKIKLEVIDNDSIQEQSLNDIGARILAILNSAFFKNENSVRQQAIDNAAGKGRGAYSGELANIVKEKTDELDNLLTIINYPNDKKAEMIRGFKLGTSNKKIDGDTYKNFKSTQAEELMMHLLQCSNQGFRSIVSGQMYNMSKQLIEDGFVFDSNKEFIFDKDMNYRVVDKKTNKESTYSVKSLDEFFNQVNSLNGNYSVHLDNDLYEKLQELSLLKAQSKSGYEVQKLINDTKNRGAIALENLEMYRALTDLYYLFWLDQTPNQDDKYFKVNGTSKTLEGLANYALSKSIQKTTLLANDIYFTKDGFITASKWMTTHNHMLKFKPGVNSLSLKMMQVVRPYSLEKVKT